jgi:hypothetical protein
VIEANVVAVVAGVSVVSLSAPAYTRIIVLASTGVVVKSEAGTFALAALASDQWVDLKAGGCVKGERWHRHGQHHRHHDKRHRKPQEYAPLHALPPFPATTL